MRVWRIDRDGRDPLEGLGGLYAGGRWNPKGIPIVYTSAHLSLAILETLVHVEPGTLPENLVAFEIDVPGDEAAHERLPVARMPRDWRAEPPPASTRELGQAWLTDPARGGVLGVPSVVVPRETNYLLNPSHADAARWRVVHREAFRFDTRLV
jgi:RES domain-containing protein